MKVIASVQAKRSSSRGLVHYIAHSKVDAGKEQKGREIFNEYSDKTTVEKANDLLKKNASAKRPTNDELHHLVLSFKSEDYERLGKDEKERQKSLKEITRHTMKQFEKEIGADKLSWAAGVHRNTDNPHVHIAIQKEYFDKNLEKKSLNKIPVNLFPHYEKVGEEKTFKSGILIEAAGKKLDEILLKKEREISHKHNRQNQTADKGQNKSNNSQKIENFQEAKSKAESEQERTILAQAILAKYYLEKRRGNLESLVDHGDKRRFKIFDEISKQNRKMSLFDLERRAEKRANRNIKKQNITDPAKKDELRKNLVEGEFEKNAEGIKRIKTILHNLVVKENRELGKRENDYKNIKPLAEKIRSSYKSQNKKLPIPLLSPDDLEMLQAGSLEKKDIRVANYFEKVRKELSKERRIPTRSDDEIAKLKGRKTFADLKIQWLEQQLKDFNDHKRAFPIEINGGKWTLSKVDSLIEKKKQDDKRIVGKVSKIFSKIGFIEEKTSLKQLEEIKAVIAEKLSEKNEQMISDLTGEKSIQTTLDDFYKNDTNPEKENLPAKFTAAELAEVESFAFDLKLADVYRENWELQKQLIENAQGLGKNGNDSLSESKENVIAGRAIAREILTEIEVARCKEEFAAFKKNKDFQKFEITDQKSGEAKFVSLSEVRFDSRGSLFDQTLEYFLENRDKRRTRNTLEKIVKEKGIELKENLKSAKDLLKVAGDITADFRAKSFFGATRYFHQPIFTPKELMTIELRILNTKSKSEAGKLQKILDSTDHSKAKNLSAILESFAAEKELTKFIEKSSVNEQKSAVKVDKDEVKSQEKTIEIRENKIEIINQERGR
ncbi:MAG TPA: relaxase MobL [Pyrinomonadaceae bacterium]|nr:relaxase MobL [Pyrinomonadaceae bacterium]